MVVAFGAKRLERPTGALMRIGFATKIRGGLSYITVPTSPQGGVAGGNDDPRQSEFSSIYEVTGGEERCCGQIDRGLMVDG